MRVFWPDSSLQRLAIACYDCALRLDSNQNPSHFFVPIYAKHDTSHRTEIVGSLDVRRSRYAKRGQMDGGSYVGEGTKHFQLARLDQGWQIVAMCWIDDATDGVASA